MKVKVTLYGCLRHFHYMPPKTRKIAFKELAEVWKQRFASSITYVKVTGNVTFEVNLETMPIDRTFIADVELISPRKKRVFASSQLHHAAKELGNLWVEYVRTFVDSGALIAIRVRDSKTQVRWSPHGK